MTNVMQTFFSEANAKGARSTALHSLQWVIGMILTSIPISLWAKAPFWLTVSQVIILGVVFCVFLGAYIYLLIKNPDALRSEQFTLSKIALEKGLVGDSINGLIEYEKHITINEQKQAIQAQGIN